VRSSVLHLSCDTDCNNCVRSAVPKMRVRRHRSRSGQSFSLLYYIPSDMFIQQKIKLFINRWFLYSYIAEKQLTSNSDYTLHESHILLLCTRILFNLHRIKKRYFQAQLKVIVISAFYVRNFLARWPCFRERWWHFYVAFEILTAVIANCSNDVSQEHQFTFSGLHGDIFKKTELFKFF
jgi:hypothetical protein